MTMTFREFVEQARESNMLNSADRITSVDLSDSVGDVSKAIRYKWDSITEQGEFKYIPKGELHVDPAYQRDPNDTKINELASGFSWPAFGCLIVARRKNGKYTIVEGQHRWMAAMKRSDIKTVPCLIFNSSGIEAEAATFLLANTKRKPVGAIDKFKAQLVTKDPCAVVVGELADDAGRTIGVNGPNTVACVRLMYNLARRNEALLRKIWPVVVSVCTGEPLHSWLLDAFFYIEEHLPEGTSLTDARWKSRLKDVGAVALLRGAQEAAAYYTKGGANVWAKGILKRVNKNLTPAKQLHLVGGEDQSDP